MYVWLLETFHLLSCPKEILDRSVMVISAIIDYQYISNNEELMLYYLSIICYFSSKRPIFHGMAHMFITTLLHGRLLISS